jgi:hypothetical protein
VTEGERNFRVGNGVAVSFLESIGNQTFAQQVLIACDGDWVGHGDIAASSVQVDRKEVVLRKLERMFDEPPMALGSFHPLRELKGERGEALRKLGLEAYKLCGSASREPPRKLFPVARTSDGYYIAVVTGTAKKAEGSIELWIRSTHTKKVPVLDKRGKQIVLSDGTSATNSVPSGWWTMQRIAVYCMPKVLVTQEVVAYGPGDTFRSRTGAQSPESVIPGTAGEQILENVCKIYG